MSRIAIFSFLSFLIVTSIVGAKESVPPFWMKEKGDLANLIADRKIPVSVKSTEISDKKHHLRLQGIGEVSAPFTYTQDWAHHLPHLLRVSDYAREVTWNTDTKILYLHTEAFNYHARMHLKVVSEDEKGARNLRFHVIKGVFMGMKGNLRVEKHQFASSLVSIDADYYYSKWNIPALFLEFGLEIVLQKFAERLRGLIEEDFKAGKPAMGSKKPLEKKK